MGDKNNLFRIMQKIKQLHIFYVKILNVNLLNVKEINKTLITLN
jgi:hypothetical protein